MIAQVVRGGRVQKSPATDNLVAFVSVINDRSKWASVPEKRFSRLVNCLR